MSLTLAEVWCSIIIIIVVVVTILILILIIIVFVVVAIVIIIITIIMSAQYTCLVYQSDFGNDRLLNRLPYIIIL